MFLLIIIKQVYHCCLFLFLCLAVVARFLSIVVSVHSEYRSVFAFSNLPPKPYVFR